MQIKPPLYAEDLLDIFRKCSSISSLSDPNGGRFNTLIPTFDFNSLDYELRMYIKMKKEMADAA